MTAQSRNSAPTEPEGIPRLARSSSSGMRAGDRVYVGASLLLMAMGVSMLVYAAVTRRFGWGGASFGMLAVYGGVICALLGLHGQGILRQLARASFFEPLPVFVCLCLDLLVAVLLAVGMLFA